MNQRYILILGANSDIAKETAKLYAKNGFNLYLASRNFLECKKTAADINFRYGVDVQPIAFDAKNLKSHNQFYQALKIKPEGAILSFGVMHSQDSIHNDSSKLKDIVYTNFLGAISILEIIAKNFKKRNSGFIVAISSVAGDRGRQSNYIYGSSKAALSSYLEGLRHMLSHSNVSVLTVKPGFVYTKMTEGLVLPKLLTVESEQVAKAIYYGVIKRKSVIYVKPIWKFIMLIIIHLPNFIFYKTKL